MKRVIMFGAMLVCVCGMTMAQTVRLATAYTHPALPGTPTDSLLHGLGSIRGCTFDADVDGDGKSEIAVTNYNDRGHVHIFEVVGNDSIELVWTSPTLTLGASSTPRYVAFGDLDGDGKKEVVYQSNANGVYVFEWDGVTGSDNYGTIPSLQIAVPPIVNANGNAEYFEITDVDGDGSQELLIAYNSAPNSNDIYYILRTVGDFATNDPGFASSELEFRAGRTTELAAYRLTAGSPIAMISANLDGTGPKEVILHGWNKKCVSPMRCTGPDTYVLAETAGGKQDVLLGGEWDDVALFGGMAYDVDGDGREEVYLPTYPGANLLLEKPNEGWVHMLSWDGTESLAVIDSATNVTLLDLSGLVKSDLFGYGYGDIDGDGRPNLYFSGGYGVNVVTAEFQGGDKRNPANWELGVVYAGTPDIYTAIVYSDSLGEKDTSYVVDLSFASKIWARNTDCDRDGLEDMILPYQAVSDSTTVRERTWNAGASKWDTLVAMNILNPKRWGLRVIEKSGVTGVEEKDLTLISPEDYKLEQNYPNPFNPSTSIRFILPVTRPISLVVYDLLGREVKKLINNEVYEKGSHSVEWDGTGANGRQAASGTYVYTLRFGNFSTARKMMLVK